VIEQYSKGYLLVHDSVKQVRAGNDEINLELQAIREKMSLMMSKMDRLLVEQKNSAESKTFFILNFSLKFIQK